MVKPMKNRLHDYEAGWLTLLGSMRVATGTKPPPLLPLRRGVWSLSYSPC